MRNPFKFSGWRDKSAQRNLILRNLFASRTITHFDIVIFLRQFASLMTAGIPILKSCEILAKSQTKTVLSELILQIKREIGAGKSLYTCFKYYSQYFDELTCQMIFIGEKTGKLETVLLGIAENQERQLRFRRKLKQALFYPFLIMLTAISVSLCMLIFIIPKFIEIFKHSYNQLPLFTRIVFNISMYVKNNLLVLSVSLLIVTLLGYYFRQKSIAIINQLIYALPPLKALFRKIILVRFCRNLALSFAAGIPISEALKLSAKTNQDPEFSLVIAKLRSRIYAGIELNHAMDSLLYFPSLMTQMVKIGEESGFLEQMLNKIAEFFETDIESISQTITTMLEPLIILILGVLIGGLVIAMYLPIFKLGNII